MNLSLRLGALKRSSSSSSIAGPQTPNFPTSAAPRAGRQRGARRNAPAPVEAWAEPKPKEPSSRRRSLSAASTMVTTAATRTRHVAEAALVGAEHQTEHLAHTLAQVVRNSRLERYWRRPNARKANEADPESLLEERMATTRLNETRVQNLGSVCDRSLILARWATQEARNRHVARTTYLNRQREDFPRVGTEAREILREVFSDVRAAVRICCVAYRAVELMQESAQQRKVRIRANLKRIRAKVIATNRFCTLLSRMREAREAEKQWRDYLESLATGSKSTALASQNPATFSVEIARLQANVDLDKLRAARAAIDPVRSRCLEMGAVAE